MEDSWNSNHWSFHWDPFNMKQNSHEFPKAFIKIFSKKMISQYLKEEEEGVEEGEGEKQSLFA